MKRLFSYSLALILIWAGFCAPCGALNPVDARVGDVVDIWVFIANGGTAILTPRNGSPPPTENRLVLSNVQSEAFHVYVNDVGIFSYSLSVEPDERDIVFDTTVYDVEIHALYENGEINTTVVVYNTETGDKYTPVKQYDPTTESYTHVLSVSFANAMSGHLSPGSPSRSRNSPSRSSDPPSSQSSTPDSGESPPGSPDSPSDGSTPDSGESSPGSPDSPSDGSTPDSGKSSPGNPDSPSGSPDSPSGSPDSPSDGSTSDSGESSPGSPDSPSDGSTPDSGETPPKNPSSPPDGPGSPPGSQSSPPGSVGSTPDSAGSPPNSSSQTQGSRTGTSGAARQPKTGDDSRLTRYLLLAMIASAGLFAVSVAYYISVDIETKGR